MCIFYILMFILEAFYAALIALLSFLLCSSYFVDILFIFLTSGIAVTLLLDNPTFGLITAILISIGFHRARNTTVVKKNMMIISSIILSIITFLWTLLFHSILFSILAMLSITIGLNS